MGKHPARAEIIEHILQDCGHCVTAILQADTLMIDTITSLYLPFLKRVLTPTRLLHSMGVMQVMGELAKIYGLDEKRALTTGLLHDAAKDLPAERVQKIVAEARIKASDPCERDYVLYQHGPVGAYFVMKELGVTDLLILDAIYRHTWMGEHDPMYSPLVWCLRFADILEPNRRWDDAARKIREGEPRLRKAVFAGKLKEAAFYQTDMLIQFFNETGKPVHSNYYQAYRELLKEYRSRTNGGAF